MKKIIKKTLQYGQHTLTLETGRIARQADAAVLVTMGDAVVLVSAVGKRKAKADLDFFPLTVNYQEKFYAAGRFPGGYFKREGRPTERETLISRLIDRPIRPLFPKGFHNEVQVIATVMSYDPAIQPDIPALIGASAALALSGMPFQGPIGAARVGYQAGEYLLNPSQEQIADGSSLDLVVAGTSDAVLMVESEASGLSESVMLGAVLFGHQQMQVIIETIGQMCTENAQTAWDWAPAEQNKVWIDALHQHSHDAVKEAYQVHDKQTRRDMLAQLLKSAIDTLSELEEGPDEKQVAGLFHALEKTVVRSQILAGAPRIDGRDTKTVRPISIETGLLPRTHGSALFTRGETQALAVTTLGTERDQQLFDELGGDRRDPFLLHYNFPPYSVGEVGFMSGPKRREIGHGMLAKRALKSVIPSMEEFPYAMRIVSEVTESNGSSSMATVCGASLSMMDAGVPLKAPVAGIAMGLIKEQDQFAVLTDILGDEDHLGDMDFKVAGTDAGITALQMDIKISGITAQIMEQALEQARVARMHILELMNAAISGPREEVSQHAPRIITFKINPDKIRDVIGKGGAVIRQLTEETRSTIDISDDGVVKIAAVNSEDGQAAIKRVQELTAEVEIGQTYNGKVESIKDFGAFVSVLPGKQGLVHVSQIAEQRVEDVRDWLREGQSITVKVTEVDRQGRIRLTMRGVEQPAEETIN